MTSLQRNWLIALVLLAALIAAYYVYLHPGARSAGPTASATSTEDGAIDLSGISTTTHRGGYTITPIYDTPANAPKAPDYTAPVAFSASVSADVRAAVNTQMADVKTILDKNPKDIDAWLRLGTLHKIGGDVKAAESVWLYVSTMWPSDYIAYNNLAALYREEGRIAEARTMYTKAISTAKKENLPQVATELQADLNALK